MNQERDNLAAVSEWIGFAASVIKSGEPWTDTCEDRYQKARQGLDALQSGGEGWRLVPVEPTPKMLAAFYETTNRDWGSDIDATCRLTWEVMLDASPSTHGEG